jgi:hypothetical protein
MLENFLRAGICVMRGEYRDEEERVLIVGERSPFDCGFAGTDARRFLAASVRTLRLSVDIAVRYMAEGRVDA